MSAQDRSTATAEFEELLRAHGAPDLDAAEREALDARGFVVLKGLLGDRELDEVRTVFEEEVATAPAGASGGTRHAPELEREPSVLTRAALHPRVLAAALHVLGRPFTVLQLGARDPGRGHGLQGLHTDWLPRMPDEPAAVVTSLLLLDDYTDANGATRVVPGSHRLAGPLPRSYRMPDATHPDEELVIAPAGAALVFDGHLLHSGTRNHSGEERRVLQLQLVARDRRPPTAGPDALLSLLGGD